MPHVYRHGIDGSFLVGDTETGRTSYAPAISIWARNAIRNPDSIAELMLEDENQCPVRDETGQAVDRMRWRRLEPLPPRETL